MPTLVLPPRYTHDTNLIRKAAIRAGWTVERLPNWRVPERLQDQDIVIYGEPLFAAAVADALGLALIEPAFDWLTTLPIQWLQRQVQFTTLATARHSGRAFIKPADDKCFVAQVYESGAELPDGTILPDVTPVLISDPVHWAVEFRCFIRERQLISLSPYFRNGQLCQAEDGSWPATEDERHHATRFINALLADPLVKLPPAVVIDIGIIANVGWAVIEANPAWGSGIYGCDPDLVLAVLQRTCHPLTAVPQEDAQWLPTRVVSS